MADGRPPISEVGVDVRDSDGLSHLVSEIVDELSAHGLACVVVVGQHDRRSAVLPERVEPSTFRHRGPGEAEHDRERSGGECPLQFLNVTTSAGPSQTTIDGRSSPASRSTLHGTSRPPGEVSHLAST